MLSYNLGKDQGESIPNNLRKGVLVYLHTFPENAEHILESWLHFLKREYIAFLEDMKCISVM